MFDRILLAFDGSPSSASALRSAADIAGRYDAELHLLGIVLATGAMPLGEVAPDDAWGMEKDHIRQAMNLAAIELRTQGHDVVATLCIGDPGTTIVDYASRIQADLVVVGHTGKGIFARLFEGSVGAQLLNHLPCHLLITPNQSGER